MEPYGSRSFLKPPWPGLWTGPCQACGKDVVSKVEGGQEWVGENMLERRESTRMVIIIRSEIKTELGVYFVRRKGFLIPYTIVVIVLCAEKEI